jgi:hypothetical protein
MVESVEGCLCPAQSQNITYSSNILCIILSLLHVIVLGGHTCHKTVRVMSRMVRWYACTSKDRGFSVWFVLHIVDPDPQITGSTWIFWWFLLSSIHVHCFNALPMSSNAKQLIMLVSVGD